MEIVNFKPYKKGALEGYMDILIPQLNWTLKGCTLFSANGRKWVSMPTRTYKNENGETKYMEVIQMPKEMKTKFNEEALKAYKKFSEVQVPAEEPALDPEMDLPF